MKLKLWMLLVFGIICLLCLRCLNWYFVLTMPGRRGARTWLGFLRIFWNKVSSASAIRCSSSKSVAQYPWRLQRRMNAFNLCLSAAVIKGSTSSFDRCVEVTYGPFGFVLWWISFHVTTLSRPLVVDVPTVKMRPASNARLSNPQISSPSALPGR